MFSDRFIFSKSSNNDKNTNYIISLFYISSISIIWCWLNFYPILTAMLLYIRIRTNLILVDKKCKCKNINRNFLIGTYLSIIYKFGYNLYFATIWAQVILGVFEWYPKLLNYIFPKSKQNSYFTIVYFFLHLWMCWG